MPFKVWQVGEEVLAADFNAELGEQVISTFPTSAQRDAAILAPKVGQYAFVVDVGMLTYWNGTGWAAAAIASAGAGMIPHSQAVRLVPTQPASVTGNTYQDYPPANAGGPLRVAGFVKARADTKIHVRVTGYGYAVNAAGFAFNFAINDGTTDRDIQGLFPENIQQRRPIAAVLPLVGVAAGTYTYTLRCKTSAAAGVTAWATDVSDTWTMEVTETL